METQTAIESPRQTSHSHSADQDTAGGTFEQFITTERVRLATAREAALAKKAEIDAKITAIDSELAAIDAYEAAKSGKLPKPRRSGSRGRRGGQRPKVIEVIAASDNGLTRGEIIEALGIKGDKSGEQAVSAALAALKKAGKLTQNDERKYLTVP